MERITLEADFKARQCVMASMLYYGLDVSFMPDTEYDKCATFVAEHWKLLTPLRQWMVGKPEDITTSGFRVKVTLLAANASVEWMILHKIPMPSKPPITITRPWRHDKRQGLRYLHTNEFSWRNT